MPSKSPFSARLRTLLSAGRRHEKTLYRRDAIERVQDDDVDVLRSGKGRGGGAARVARCGAEDGHALAAEVEDVVVELRDQAHRHVLEGERRAVVQLHHPAARPGLDKRRDRLVGEGRVGPLGHAADSVLGDAAPGESGENACRRFDIGRRRAGAFDLRIGFGTEQSAIGRKAHQAGRDEVDRGGIPTCGDVFHVCAGSRLPKRRRPARA